MVQIASTASNNLNEDRLDPEKFCFWLQGLIDLGAKLTTTIC